MAKIESRKPLRILILGGTGFIGIHMAAAARSRGHTVTLFNRGLSDSRLVGDVEILKGDRDGKLDALKGRQWDAVIDNSGYVPRHVRLSAELLAERVAHYLFISSISIYADFTRANDEDSPVATTDDEHREDWQNAYGALKALAEKALDRVMPGRTTMIRPGFIVGPHDNTERFTYWPLRATRGGEILAPGDPDAPFQMIDARDLAKFCIDAVEQRLTGPFNIIAPEGKFTIGDVVRESIAAANALAKPASAAQAVWVPEDFLAQQQVKPYSDMALWFAQSGEFRGFHRTRSDRAIKAGLTISPLDKTVRDTLAWHLGRSEADRAKATFGIKSEQERAVLDAWRVANKNHGA